MPDNTDTQARAVILVYSTHGAVRAERALLSAGVPCRMVPVPRQLSSECGVCLELAADRCDAAAALLADLSIETAGVHRLDR